jgi:hypothetical protein
MGESEAHDFGSRAELERALRDLWEDMRAERHRIAPPATSGTVDPLPFVLPDMRLMENWTPGADRIMREAFYGGPAGGVMTATQLTEQRATFDMEALRRTIQMVQEAEAERIRQRRRIRDGYGRLDRQRAPATLAPRISTGR